jgi:hypothetical protein
MAHYRTAQGLSAMSINWGVWAEIGSAAARNVDERVELQGIGAIFPQEGVQVLEKLLHQNITQVAVLPVDWPRFFRQYPSERLPHWLSNFYRPVAASTPERPATAPLSANSRTFQTRLRATPPSQQNDFLRSFICEKVAKVLGLDAMDLTDFQKPLNEMGLDSLMAVELRNLLSTGMNLERSLPASLVFDYPNIEAITVYLASLLLAPETGMKNVEVSKKNTSSDDILAALEDLPNEEVDRMFTDRLKAKK